MPDLPHDDTGIRSSTCTNRLARAPRTTDASPVNSSTAVALAVTVLTMLAAWWFVRSTNDAPPPSPAPPADEFSASW
jgi:hypothetical protein